MKKPYVRNLAVGLLAVFTLAFIFTGCPQSTDPEPESESGYQITIDAIVYGTVKAEPSRAEAGTMINLSVSPDPGYQLTASSLKYNDGSDHVIVGNKFTMPAHDVTVTATFESLASDTYSVTIDTTIQNGIISANPSSGIQGVTITLTVTPAEGYKLEAGSLKWKQYDTASPPVPTGDGTVVTGTTFDLPAAHVWVTAQFVPEAQLPQGSVTDLIASGTASLKNKNFDAAIDYFEAAYQKDSTNKDAIVYSTLAKLASIPRDASVHTLIAERLGVLSYPNSLDQLITSNWMTDYPKERAVQWYYDEQMHSVAWYNHDPAGSGHGAGYYYYDYSIPSSYVVFVSSTRKYETSTSPYPSLTVPDWAKTTGMYTDTLTSQGLESASTWPILVFTNLLDRNTNGLNTLLDEILSSVFGASFDEAVTRVAKLDYNTPRTRVTADTLEGLGLYDIFEGDVDMGKAELELLISSLRIVKATFEWLDAYDWNTNLSLLKFDWNDGYDAFKTKLAAMSPSDLPLRNNFLKARTNGAMTASKADYVKAIDTMLSAYEHIDDSLLPPAVIDAKNDNKWIKDGLTKLTAAINGGTAFWVPEAAPSGDTWNGSEASSSFGVDMSKLFAAGQLGLDKLIELDSGSPAKPTFYNGDEAITSKTGIGDAIIGLKLKAGPLNEIVKGSDMEDQIIPVLPPEIAEILWELYHK
jgi:hypothetical protein